MTYEQYWDGEAELTKYYRQAYEEKREEDAMNFWIIGRYFYDALLCASPMLRSSAFSKTRPKPVPFVDEVYPLTNAMADKFEKQKQEKAAKDAVDHMFQVMKMNNSRFKKSTIERGE